MKLLVWSSRVLAGAMAALALLTFLYARTIETTITDSNQNLIDRWALALLAAAVVAGAPPLFLYTVRRDRAMLHADADEDAS